MNCLDINLLSSFCILRCNNKFKISYCNSLWNISFNPHYCIKGTTLAVQWLRLHTSDAGGMDSSLAGELRSHMLHSTGFPAELFQILKDSPVKVLHSICQQSWKTQQWSQDWKRSVFISIPKKGNAKECSNYYTIVLISHASKVMLKILQIRLQ